MCVTVDSMKFTSYTSNVCFNICWQPVTRNSASLTLAVRLKTADHHRTPQTTAGCCWKPQDSYPDTAGQSYKVQTGPSNDRRTPQGTFSVQFKGAFWGSKSNRLKVIPKSVISQPAAGWRLVFPESESESVDCASVELSCWQRTQQKAGPGA